MSPRKMLVCCAVLALCASWSLADGPQRVMNATIMNEASELLPDASLVVEVLGAEPVRAESTGNGTWSVTTEGGKALLHVQDPTLGRASVEVLLPPSPGESIVELYWGATVRAHVVSFGEPTLAELSVTVTGGTGGGRDQACPAGSLFSQAPHGSDGDWSFGNSEVNVNGTNYLRAERFTGVSGEVCDIHWWGSQLVNDGTWQVCTESDPVFEIKFYDDAGNAPGTELCRYSVMPTITDTGELYAGSVPLLYYSVELLDPCCVVPPNGWVSIQGMGDTDCWFMWLSSPDGDGSSYFNNNGTPEPYYYDLSLCLTGTYIPVYGACCDDSTGTCTDGVEQMDCQQPLRFAPNTLCADLNPPCGEIPGCEHSIVLTDDYGDGWNGGTVDVLVNGTIALGGITITSGAGPETYHFLADTGDQISTVYTAGNWSEENEYHIYDFFGVEICADGEGGWAPTGGDCGLGNCIPVETPPNDLCADAIAIGVPSVTLGTTNGATLDDSFPECETSITAPGVWYTVVGTGTTITVDTCGTGTDYDTKLSVYCGDCVDPICIAGNDDYCGLQSLVSWCSQPGATYYILVHGFSSATGNFELSVFDDGVPCEGAVKCLPEGACCLPDHSCVITTEVGCLAQGGEYLGDDTDCGTHIVELLAEDFNAGIPANWTVTDDMGLGLTWHDNVHWGDDNWTGGDGSCADVNSDTYGSAAYDTSLISPVVDLSGVAVAVLDADVNYQDCSTADLFMVDVSYDGGGSWTTLLAWNEDHGGFYGTPGEHVTLPLAGGSATTQVRFRYSNPDTSAWDWYAQVDNVVISVEVEDNNPCVKPLAVAGTHLIGSGTEPGSIAYDVTPDPGEKSLGTRLARIRPVPLGGDEPGDMSIPPSPAPGRVSASEKGSVLIYPKVELRWNQAGELIQDTFITVNNDYYQDVHIVMYFVTEFCSPTYHDTTLTANEAAYWSAATGFPKMVGQFHEGVEPYPDPEGSNEMIVRGFIVLFATDQENQQIRWNHLYGSAAIGHYEGAAWEYNAYAFQALDPVVNGQVVGVPGRIELDGSNYAPCFETLLLDFFASNDLSDPEFPSAFGDGIMIDTDLTMLIMNLDLTQGGQPFTTKADFWIWNQNEDSRRAHVCFTCWDESLLSNLGGPFVIENLQTDKGRARIEGIENEECPGSTKQPLLGVAAKVLTLD